MTPWMEVKMMDYIHQMQRQSVCLSRSLFGFLETMAVSDLQGGQTCRRRGRTVGAAAGL